MKRIFTLAIVALLGLWTFAPKANAQCGSGQSSVTFTLDMTNDNYPGENAWKLVLTQSGTALDSACFGAYSGGVQTLVACLDTGLTYSLYAYDEWGDGLDGAEYRIEYTYGPGIDTIGAIELNIPSLICGVTEELEDSTSFYIAHFPAPSCLDPDTLTASNLTTTSADLNWTDPNSATEWEIEYGTTGFTQGTGTVIHVTSTLPYNLGGLSINTTYDWYVRSICSVGDTSAWSAISSFTTLCNAFSIPFTETFNSSSSTQTCWIVADANNDGDTWDMDDTYAPFEGDEGVSVYTDGNGGSNDDYLISPTITLSGNQRLRYYVRARSSFEPNDYEVLISTNGVGLSSFTNTLLVDTVDFTTYQERIIDLSAYSGSVNIAFHIPQGSLDGWYLYVDSVSFEEIPSCIIPNSLANANINSSSVDLSWIENSGATEWQIEYDTTGFVQGTGRNVIIVNSNPYNLSGLTASTTYDWYVRSICAAGDSSRWSVANSFTTECLVYTPPYLTDFSTFLPDCWEQADDSIPSAGPHTFGSSNWGASDFLNSASNGSGVAVNIYSDFKEDWLISPEFDLGSGGAYELRLDAGVTDWNGTTPDVMGADDTVQVLISTDGGATWKAIYTWDVNNQPPNTGQKYTLDLSVYTGVVQFALWVGENTDNSEDYDFHISNFEVRSIPQCLDPTILATTNIVTDSAEVNWVENGVATEWQIEYDTAGFTVGSGRNRFVTTTNPDTLTGLMANTTYDVYLRSICGRGDTSAWSSFDRFTTLCSTFSPPYSTNFSTFLPNCWDEADDGIPLTGPNTFGSSQWGSGNFLNSAANGSGVLINLYSNTKSDWLISPEFDLSAGGPYQIEIDAGVTDWLGTTPDAMDSDDTVQVVISVDGGTTWSALYTWDVNNQPPNTGQTYTINLSAYTGSSNIIGIWATENASGTQDYHFHISNFNIKTIPSCPKPTAGIANNLTPSSVDLSWTENGAATEWQIEYDTAGFTLGNGRNRVVTTSKPHSIASLTSNTSYDWYVRSICGVGDTSAWSGLATFITKCPAISIFPYMEDFESAQLGEMPNCWANRLVSGSDNWVTTDASGFNDIDTAHAGSQYLEKNYSSSSAIAISPAFDLTALGGNARIRVWLHRFDVADPGDQYVVLINDGDSLNGADTLFTLNSITTAPPAVASSGWYEYTINIPASYNTVSTAYIMFRGITSAGFSSYDLGIDNFVLELGATCPEPTMLTLSNVSTNSVDVNWTENGTATEWQIEYDTSGFTLGSGRNSIVTISKPYSIASLASSTTYDVYVRSICGVGDTSAWSVATTFTTKCLPIAAFPHTEDFESAQLGEMPNCWTSRLVSGSDNWGTTDASGFNDIDTAHAGSQYLEKNYSSSSAIAISPAFDLTALGGNARIRVWLHRFNVADPGDQYLVLINDGDSLNGADTLFTLNSIITAPPAVASSGWYEYIINIPASYNTVSTAYIMFRGVTSAGFSSYDLGIDNFVLELGVTCPEPIMLTSSNTVGNRADLSWVEMGSATEWQIEYDTSGFALGSGRNSIVTTSNPYSISSLALNTTYDVYVRSICGVGDTSAWSVAATFTTSSLSYYPIGVINTEDANGDADSVNVECSISGTVVGYDRSGGGGYEFALVDLSSGSQEGIAVFEFNDVSGYTNPTEGDSLLIFGSVDQFRGLTQFRPDSIVVLGTGTVPMPDTAITLDESTESILIQMNDWILLDQSQLTGSYDLRAVDVATGLDTIIIRIDSDSEISDSLAVVGNGWVVGDTICSLVGVGGQYDFNSPYTDSYQVFPSLFTDVVLCKNFTNIQRITSKAKSINIYPNPTVGQFTVKSSGLNNDNAIITVRDISGRVVLQDNIARSNSPFTKQYDLNGKAKGLYFISIIDGEERINQKLIVQ